MKTALNGRLPVLAAVYKWSHVPAVAVLLQKISNFGLNFYFVGGLHVKMKEYHMTPASFVSIASGRTTTLMGIRLAILRLIHFLTELLFNEKTTGIHFISRHLFLTYELSCRINGVS